MKQMMHVVGDFSAGKGGKGRRWSGFDEGGGGGEGEKPCLNKTIVGKLFDD